ncbi:MAG: 4-hydroxy-tetrahydrodipicolinate reductase [Rhodospirillales bacterium]
MKIGIVGCAGRMGRMLVSEVLAEDGLALAGGAESPGHAALGQDVAALAGAEAAGIAVSDDIAALFAASDAVIDFTVPATAQTHAKLAADHGAALVLGTTGLSADDQRAVKAAAKNIPVVQAANMSVGVNLLLGLAERVAGLLGEEYDIEIVEMHHRHKIDAPSGTALALGRAAAAGRKVDLDKTSVRSRDGITGPRAHGAIGFASLRGGDVVGDHSVIFAADGERIELTHKASSRAVFAKGAVRAARWTEGRAAGLYSMRDVLGFS